MIALDTNLLVRLLTRDDATQANRVVALLRKHPAFVPKTVLLETEWVLRYAYDLDRSTIHQAFAKLVGVEGLTLEDAPAVAFALDWYEQGLDFADALHLASSREAERFATFDRALAGKARRLEGAIPVVTL